MSGSFVCSSKKPQAISTTVPPMSSDSVSGLVQPHSPPFETGSRMLDQPDREEHRAGKVESSRCAQGAHRDDGEHEHERHDSEQCRQPEQVVPVEGLGDERGNRQADGAPDAEGRADQRDGGGQSLRVDDVAQDADAQRDDAEPDPLQGAADDHRNQRQRQRRDDRAEHHDHQECERRASLAEHVPEPTADRCGNRRSQQRGGEHPLRIRDVGVEQFRQQRDDRGRPASA